MFINIRYKPGWRVYKTVLAVSLALLVSLLLPGRDRGLFAAFCAIFAMAHTPSESFHYGVHQVVGTMVGGLFGYLTLLWYSFFPQYFRETVWIVVPLVLLVDMYLCNVIHEAESSSVSCAVVISIVIGGTVAPPEAFTIAINRVVDSLIGIVIGFLVNRFICPQPEQKSQEVKKLPKPSKRQKHLEHKDKFKKRRLRS